MLRKVVFSLFFICCSLATANDTLLKLYRPYGEAAEQTPLQIKSTLTGDCFSQSQLIIREDAWRCSAGGTIYDPCFIKFGPNRTQALCPKSPWNGDSVLLQLKQPLNNEVNKTLDMSRAYPWGVELVNGELCKAVNSEKTFDQLPVRYQCTKENYLVGHLQRCKSLWTMLEQTPAGIRTVEINKAWF